MREVIYLHWSHQKQLNYQHHQSILTICLLDFTLSKMSYHTRHGLQSNVGSLLITSLLPIRLNGMQLKCVLHGELVQRFMGEELLSLAFANTITSTRQSLHPRHLTTFARRYLSMKKTIEVYSVYNKSVQFIKRDSLAFWSRVLWSWSPSVYV